MRVSPNGEFHGLRPSHGCRAACRVPADPGLAESRFVLLRAGIDTRTYISASPDLFPEDHRGGIHGVAGDLEIPTTLRADIEDWIAQFRNNFVHLADRPVDRTVWQEGFDEIAWLERGHGLADQLGEVYPDHLACCCAAMVVECEIAAEQLSYVCLLTGQYAREHGQRMPGNEPDPDVPKGIRLAPEYGLEWGMWAKQLRYRQPPRLLDWMGFPTPRSLDLTADLEERLRKWNDDWNRGYLGISSGRDRSVTDLGLTGIGFDLPRWSDDVDPIDWYREGMVIAAQMAEELPGVPIRLDVADYVHARRFLDLTGAFDDEFYTPVET